MRRPEHDISFRKQAVARILPPKREKLKDVALDLQISVVTLMRWRDEIYFISSRSKKGASKSHADLKNPEVERRILELHGEGYSDAAIKERLGSVNLPTVRQTIKRHQESNPQPGDSSSLTPSSPKRQHLTGRRRLVLLEELVTRRPEELNPAWLFWEQASFKEMMRRYVHADQCSSFRFYSFLKQLGVDNSSEVHQPLLPVTPAQTEDFLHILRQSYCQRFPLFKVSLYQLGPLHMISALTKMRGRSFLLYRHVPSVSDWVDFFDRLCRNSQYGRAFVVMERDPILDAGAVAQWLQHNSDRIKVFVPKEDGIVEQGSGLQVAALKSSGTGEFLDQGVEPVESRIRKLLEDWTLVRNYERNTLLSGKKQYDQAFKNEAVARTLPPNYELVKDVARELNIAEATLSRWRFESNKKRPILPRTSLTRLPEDERIAVERQIIELFCAGLTLKAIAGTLVDISYSAIVRHIKAYKESHPLPDNKPYPRQRNRTLHRATPKEKRGNYLFPKAKRAQVLSGLIKRRPENLIPGKFLWDRDALYALLTQQYSFDQNSNQTFRTLLHKLEIITPIALWTPFLKTATLPQKMAYQALRREAIQADRPLIIVSLAQTLSASGWMISALANKRHLGMLFFRKEPTAVQWVDFFKRLFALCGKKAYVILDHQHPFLCSPPFMNWLHEHSDRLQVFFVEADGITRHEDAFQQASAMAHPEAGSQPRQSEPAGSQSFPPHQ